MGTAVSKCMNRLINKRDFIYLAILLAVAFIIGLYLIATTVLISEDGVFYIEQARKLHTEPLDVIKEHHLGYPFLIFIVHKVIALFSNNQSVNIWIYSAQSVSLLCRLLALIPLYFIGKFLVEARTSFLAILILVLLPYPAKFGSDVLRDWPYILFLTSGFLLLLNGAKRFKCWMFGAAGLLAGLGHIIRPECAQLILYGALWLLIGLFLPKRNMNRTKLLCALFVLLIGFLIPAAPYIKIRGRILLPKAQKHIISSRILESEKTKEQTVDYANKVCTASSLPSDIVKAIGKLVEDISDNLLYYFMPVWLIGIYFRFRKQGPAMEIERFFVPFFVVLNIIVLILVSCNWGYLSRRYSLSLVVLTIFYVPVGLQVLSDWLRGRFGKDRLGSGRNQQLWFLVLFMIGIVICMPKLIKPMRMDKQNYRYVARWLAMNTDDDDLIGVPDKRISFYAERKGLIYNRIVPDKAKYVVALFKDDRAILIEKQVPGAQNVFSVSGNGRNYSAEVYDIRNCISERVSFAGYNWEKVGVEKYRFSFMFQVKNGFEKDWAIYFHGWVKDEDVNLLRDRRENKFENWDFYPQLATSDWPGNDYVTVTREISAKPISYNIDLGFYTVRAGRHGRGVNLGWVDLGDAKQSDGR